MDLKKRTLPMKHKENCVLRLVLTNNWFDKIKSKIKKHEYRLATPFWFNRLLKVTEIKENNGKMIFKPFGYVTFQRAYYKNPEMMTFKIKNIYLLENGLNTDLKTEQSVFDIELGIKKHHPIL